MITTVNILDLLKDELGSDYQTAKRLKLRPSRISELRHKGGCLTDEQGLEAAKILNFPPEAIILSLVAERSLNGPAFKILTHLADQFDPRKTAAAAFFFITFCSLHSLQNIPFLGA